MVIHVILWFKKKKNFREDGQQFPNLATSAAAHATRENMHFLAYCGIAYMTCSLRRTADEIET